MTQYDKPDGRFRHGMAKKHPLYGRWVGMRQRCTDKNHPAYARYGGAGIFVCERWDDFSVFVADMGDCPAGMSLERKDNALGYSPENCIWASGSVQARNRRMTIWIEFDGQTKCVSDWAKHIGLSYAALKERIDKWGAALALSTPKRAPNAKKFIRQQGN